MKFALSDWFIGPPRSLWRTLQRTGRMLGPPTHHLGTAFHSLETTVSSGLPLDRCLELAAQTIAKDDPKLATMLGQVQAKVSSGTGLATAMGGFPRFPKVYVQATRAAETSGQLDQVLKRLSQVESHHCVTRMKVYQALVYPAVMMGVTFFLNALVLPYLLVTLIPVFGDESELPWLTQLVLKFAQLMRTGRFWLAVVLTASLIPFLLDSPYVRLRLSGILDSFPRVKHGFRVQAYSNLFSVLNICHSAGIPIKQALDSAAAACGDLAMAEQIRARTQLLLQGNLSVSEVFSDFEPIARHLIAAGEESGQLDKMFAKLEEHYRKVFEGQIELVVGLINPVLTIGNGLVVGVVVCATILPVGNLLDAFL